MMKTWARLKCWLGLHSPSGRALDLEGVKMLNQWEIRLPAPESKPERPPFSADDYPLGTIAEKDGIVWYVVWDNQNKRNYWNTENKDI